jgi:L-lysine 2,3-aminomutase
MTEADVRELYMDEVYAMQKLHNVGIDLGNQKKLDKGKDE